MSSHETGVEPAKSLCLWSWRRAPARTTEKSVRSGRSLAAWLCGPGLMNARCVLRSGFFAAVIAMLSGCEWGSIGYNKGYAPEQPIPFSHELHAGNYKVQCLYCHSSAERASHSAVPSLSVCMNCHIQVATDKPAIQQLTEAYTNNKPIPWKKVHLLPDHVRFNHSAHVDRFGAPNACHKCHGPVESMEVLYQHSSLSMGWCVNCHREPENQAPVSCSTCHY